MGYEAPMASAQVLYGSIVGTVLDQANAAVPKAMVKVTNTSTGLSRQAATDDAGYYSVQNLIEGIYDLSVTASGFRPLTQKSVNVLINNVTRVDVRLEVGRVTESVPLDARDALHQTTKTETN